jgi:hypothetical protein
MGTNSVGSSISWAALSNYKSLSTIGMSNNAFAGRLPPTGNFCTVLEIFIADSNRITGSITGTLANLTNILILSQWKQPEWENPNTYHHNEQSSGTQHLQQHLVWTIPEEISGLTSLVKLHLDGNKLAGSIPSSVNSLSQLQVMTLSQNSLSSIIPTNLWHL